MKSLLILLLLSVTFFFSCDNKAANRDALLKEYADAALERSKLEQKYYTLPGAVYVWKWKESVIDARLILVERDSVEWMFVIHKDDSQMQDQLSKTRLSDGRIRYDYSNDNREYYIIENDGSLGMYSSSDEKFLTASLIKRL